MLQLALSIILGLPPAQIVLPGGATLPAVTVTNTANSLTPESTIFLVWELSDMGSDPLENGSQPEYVGDAGAPYAPEDIRLENPK
ncbi:MAG: hypothetical protein KDA63_03950 [Planctomycetales bacterium]|nr:hypothetical protein [Planctomycetales bacterium]